MTEAETVDLILRRLRETQARLSNTEWHNNMAKAYVGTGLSIALKLIETEFYHDA